ncbi:SlyX family protein [Halomonas sp. LS-001]
MTETLSPAELYQRIETLETRLAFQEDWLDTLDHAVTDQARRLDKLEQVSVLMHQRLREQQYALQTDNDTAEPRPEDDIPPHY